MPFAFPAARTASSAFPPMSEEEQNSAMRQLFGMGGSLLSGAAQVLDLPGSTLRDIIASATGTALPGQNPYDQWLDWFNPAKKMEGREQLRRWGAVGQDKNWGNFLGGLAYEIGTDPLTPISGGLNALGQTARAVQLTGRAARGAAISGSTGKILGAKTMRTMEGGGDLVKSLAGQFDDALMPHLEGLGGKSLASRLDRQAARHLGRASGDYSGAFDALSKLHNNQLGGLFSYGFGPLKFQVGTGDIGRGIAKQMDRFSGMLGDTQLGQLGKQLMEPGARNMPGLAAQQAGRLAMLTKALKDQAVKETMDTAGLMSATFNGLDGKPLIGEEGQRIHRKAFQTMKTAKNPKGYELATEFVPEADAARYEEFITGVQALNDLSIKAAKESGNTISELVDINLQRVGLREPKYIHRQSQIAKMLGSGLSPAAGRVLNTFSPTKMMRKEILMGAYEGDFFWWDMWQGESGQELFAVLGKWRDRIEKLGTIKGVASGKGLLPKGVGKPGQSAADFLNEAKVEFGHVMNKWFGPGMGDKRALLNQPDVPPAGGTSGPLGGGPSAGGTDPLAGIPSETVPQVTNATEQADSFFPDDPDFFLPEQAVERFVKKASPLTEVIDHDNAAELVRIFDDAGKRPAQGGLSEPEFNELLAELKIPVTGKGKAGAIQGAKNFVTRMGVTHTQTHLGPESVGAAAAKNVGVKGAPAGGPRVANAAIRVGGKLYRGSSHLKAVKKAQDAGVIPTGQTDFDEYFLRPAPGSQDDAFDLFETTDGRIINRKEADSEFGGKTTEGIGVGVGGAKPTAAAGGFGGNAVSRLQRYFHDGKKIRTYTDSDGRVWWDRLARGTSVAIQDRAGVWEVITDWRPKSESPGGSTSTAGGSQVKVRLRGAEGAGEIVDKSDIYKLKTAAVHDRFEQIGEWVTRFSDDELMAGIFSNDPIVDIQTGLISAWESENIARIMLRVFADHATELGDTPGHKRIGELIADKSMRLTSGDLEGGALLTMAKHVFRDSGEEITKEHLKRILEMGVPKELAKQFETMRVIHNKDRGTLEKTYDSYLAWFKAVNTVPIPAFANRNFLSGQLANLVTGNWSFRAFQNSWQFATGRTISGSKNWPIIKEMYKGAEPLTDEVATELVKTLSTSHSVLGSRMGAVDLGVMSGEGASVARGLQMERAGDNPASVASFFSKATGQHPDVTANFADIAGVGGGFWDQTSKRVGAGTPRTESKLFAIAAGTEANQFVEEMNRGTAWFHNLQRGVDPFEAANRTNALQVDYSWKNYTDFERKYLTKLFPFYKWTARMIPWTIKEIIEKPGGGVAQSIRAEERMSTGGDFPYIPETLRGGGTPIPTGLKDDLDRDVLIHGLQTPWGSAMSPFRMGTTGLGFGRFAAETAKNTAGGIFANMGLIPMGPIELATKYNFGIGRNIEELDSGLGRITSNIGEHVKNVTGMDIGAAIDANIIDRKRLPTLPKTFENQLIRPIGAPLALLRKATSTIRSPAQRAMDVVGIRTKARDVQQAIDFQIFDKAPGLLLGRPGIKQFTINTVTDPSKLSKEDIMIVRLDRAKRAAAAKKKKAGK